MLYTSSKLLVLGDIIEPGRQGGVFAKILGR